MIPAAVEIDEIPVMLMRTVALDLLVADACKIEHCLTCGIITVAVSFLCLERLDTSLCP